MKNYKFLVPILLILLLVGSVYKTYSDRESLYAQYHEDLTMARQNRDLEVWVNAEEYYLNAIDLIDSVELRVELGEMYKQAGELRTAAKWGEKTVDKYPKDSLAYEFLMGIYYLQKDYGSCFAVNDTVTKRKLSSDAMNKIIDEIRYEYYFKGEYTDVADFSNGMIAVKKEEKWGYLDKDGSNEISAEFLQAGPFAAEVAPVVDENNKAYYIDMEGNRKIVIDFVDHVKELGYMSADNIFSVNDGSTWSFYSLDSKEQIAGNFDEVSAMGNGVAAVKTNEKWRLINAEGKNLTDDEYDEVAMDAKGIVCRNDRIFVKKAGKYFLLDAGGNRVNDAEFEDAKTFNDDGYAAVRINGRWGFVDTEGKTVIEPEYVEAHSFMNGFAAVRKANGWGYIDADNKQVIATGFEDAIDFCDTGRTLVKENDKWQMLILYLYNH